MDYIKALIQWCWLIAANIVLDLIGILLMPFLLPFLKRAYSLSDLRPIYTVKGFFRIFGNDFDGSLGDRRKWWDENCDQDSYFGLIPLLRKVFPSLPRLRAYHCLAQYWWMAWRNPVNNMRLYSAWQAPIAGSKITYKGQYLVEDKVGKTGWQFVTTESSKGKKYYGLYIVKPITKTHAFVIRLGFKVKPEHQGSDEAPKGMTTKISFWKEL